MRNIYIFVIVVFKIQTINKKNIQNRLATSFAVLPQPQTNEICDFLPFALPSTHRFSSSSACLCCGFSSASRGGESCAFLADPPGFLNKFTEMACRIFHLSRAVLRGQAKLAAIAQQQSARALATTAKVSNFGWNGEKVGKLHNRMRFFGF